MGYPDEIVCDRRTFAERPHTHVHPWAQLVVPIKGTLSVTVESYLVKDDRQNVVYIPPASLHSFHSRTANRFFVFDIPSAYLPKNSTLLLDHFLDNRWRAIQTLLGDEVGEKPTSNQRLSDLFRYMLRLLEKRCYPASLEYIHQFYHRQITIEELAGMEHYHPSYYCEWFQKQFGLSPMAYIRYLRLENAKDLLAHTEYNLMQIAQQVGYRHQSTLTRLFQERYRITPTAYRQKTRKGMK
ncbi:helix-turn-helix transcriptional regulator [Candidatus Formimonas warabiya]|uniref:HTH araC/xylS-type domain-containing protein n=1 Tax=Formimonas warabiya TaxID=1761012 RepID=A0A3G1KV72_FORW1|nr:AraC family transcriptional regulator [Candidatus Formimonas warabiya]ATW26349.1 hypothetical protein DCMF_17685 [Candidatus Formimonas warabiya]